MDVDAAQRWCLAHEAREELAKRHDDGDVGPRLAHGSHDVWMIHLLRLRHREPVPFRRPLDRRRAQVASAAGRPVRLRDHQDHRVAVGDEPIQRRSRELWAAHEYDAHG
jgi:hypothetical protein